MSKTVKEYIFYEISETCRAEFMMKDGEFHHTEDAVIVGISKGRTPQKAFKNLMIANPWLKEYKTYTIVAREVGEAIYIDVSL